MIRTPVNKGLLQSDLDANGFGIVNLVGSVGGGTINAQAPLTLSSTGDYTDPVTHPFTPANSGIFVLDSTGREILRLWSGNSDTTTVGHNNFNLYLGYEAGFAQPSDNTTAAAQNVGIGPWALRYITTGQGNTAVGANALRYNQAGLANVAVGASAMQSSHTLEGSTAIGVNALKDVDDGGQGGDTAIGFASLYQQHNGGDNTAVGRYSGLGVLNDNGMVFVGSGARRIGDSGVPMINAISIGYQAEVAASYTTVIGNVQHTDVYFGSVAGNAILHGKGAYPTGGTTGQVLSKNSNTAFDVSWISPAGGGNVSNSGTPTSGQYGRWITATTIEGVPVATLKTDLALTKTDVGLSVVTNDVQIKATDFPSSSVDSEISLFSGTSGKAQKRATGSGAVVTTSGVYGTVTAGAAGNIMQSDGTTWTSAARLRVTSVASSATWSPNADTTNVFTITTAQAVAVTTINNPSGTPTDSQRLMFRVKCDGTARALSWTGTQYRASSDMALPTTLIVNKTTYLGFAYNSTDTKWDLIAKMENF